MQRVGWGRKLKVRAGGKGLVGHAGMVLLRRCADRVGLTSGFTDTMPSSAAPGWIDRGTVLVQIACAIALGARNVAEIERLGLHQAPLGLDAASDSTISRTLTGIDEAARKRSGRARARARRSVWTVLTGRVEGFPWLTVAGRTLKGWIVIDMDATIITCVARKEGAAGTFKRTWGHHPLAAWCANTRESLAMTLRPGNAGSNDTDDHKRVLAANIAHDLDCWTGLLGLDPGSDLATAEITRRRFTLYAVPARLTRHARTRWLDLPDTWPWAEAFITCWQRLGNLPEPAT